jgi:hypothetical protein
VGNFCWEKKNNNCIYKKTQVFPGKGFHKLEKIYSKKTYEPDLIWEVGCILLAKLTRLDELEK